MNKTNAEAQASKSRATRACRSSLLVVLHIDDDPNDTTLLQAATRRASVPFEIRNAQDSEDAIAYLNGSGEYSDRSRFPVPVLVLLDLKMPRATGFEILTWIREHPTLGEIPVIVLSGSELQEDIRKAYDIGANCYKVKPLGFEALVNLVNDISASWLPRPRVA